MQIHIKQLALSSLVLGLLSSCAQQQPAKSPDAAGSTDAASPADGSEEGAAPPAGKAEKQQNDDSGSTSPMPGSRNEPVAPSPTRRDPEEWSSVNLLCGPSPRREAAAARW